MSMTWTAALSIAFLLLGPAAGVARGADLSGSLEGSYRYRSAPGKAGSPSYDDQDLDLLGRADAVSLLSGSVEGHLTFRAFKDIDGTAPGDTLQEIGDTFSNRDDLRIYEGYLTVRLRGRPAAVSLGRQYVPVGTGFSQSYDGLSAAGSLPGGALRVVLFGGARVSHFIEPGREWIYGGKVSATPWRGALVELSDLAYTEHYLAAEASQRFAGEGRVSGRLTAVGEDPEEFRLNGLFPAPAGSEVALEYLRKIGSGGDRKEFPFDFTSLDGGATSRLRIGVLRPYARYAVGARKRFGPSIALGVGGARRKLVHDVDEDEFNRSDWEIDGSVDLRDLPWKGLAAFIRYRHTWEDRLRTPDGSSGAASAGISYPASSWLTAGIELFANSAARTVSEPIIPEGFARIDRTERGGAAWAKWTRGRLSGELRYEATDDDLYEFYGAKAVHAATVTVSANL